MSPALRLKPGALFCFIKITESWLAKAMICNLNEEKNPKSNPDSYRDRNPK